jgi:prefoldin subunit 5
MSESELEFRRMLAKIRIINEQINKLREEIEELQAQVNELTDMIIAGYPT